MGGGRGEHPTDEGQLGMGAVGWIRVRSLPDPKQRAKRDRLMWLCRAAKGENGISERRLRRLCAPDPEEGRAGDGSEGAAARCGQGGRHGRRGALRRQATGRGCGAAHGPGGGADTTPTSPRRQGTSSSKALWSPRGQEPRSEISPLLRAALRIHCPNPHFPSPS